MQQLIIKPWAGKNDKNFEKIQKLENLQLFFKMADINFLKNIPLHLQAIQ